WVNIDQERLDRYERMFQLNPASSALYEPADIRVGHIVADFGCGPGHSAIEIAKWVGPSGHVHALDINSDFVSQSRKNANAAGVGDRVTAHQCDASILGAAARSTMPMLIKSYLPVRGLCQTEPTWPWRNSLS